MMMLMIDMVVLQKSVTYLTKQKFRKEVFAPCIMSNSNSPLGLSHKDIYEQ